MPKLLDDKDARFALLLTVGVFFFYCSWALIIPFGDAPDEALRYNIVDFIVKYRQLPVAGDSRLFYGPDGVTYAAMPYFPYIISAFLCILVQSLKLPLQLYLVSRFTSVMSGTIAVLFVCKTSQKLFPNSFARYFTPVFFAFIPQFSFISAYTNQDSFMVMLSAISIFLWVKGIEDNWNIKTTVELSVILGLLLLTYLNGYVIIVSTVLLVFLTFRKLKSKAFFTRVAISAAVVMVVAGWFFARNFILYHGDFLGVHTTNVIAQQRGAVGYRPSDKQQYMAAIGGFCGLLFSTQWPVISFQSFWGYLENMNVLLPLPYYLYIFLLTILSFVGLSALTLEKTKSGFKTVKKYPIPVALAFTAVMAFLLDVYYSLYSDYQPQGRYLFSALIPIVFLMVYGFERFFSGRAKIWFYKTVGASFVVIDILAVYGLLLTRYYG